MKRDICTTCNQEFFIDKFEKNGKNRFGNQRYRPQCKECRQSHKKESYKVRKKAKKPMGGQRCELCNHPNRKVKADHQHGTFKFRGWLCDSCNTSIGKLGQSEGDDIKGLEKALLYLKNSV